MIFFIIFFIKVNICARPCLLLQKPSRNGKTKDHSRALDDRLKLWYEGKIDLLVKEARTIQNRFRNSTNTKRTQDDSLR